MARDELTKEQIRDILCAPESTDDIKEIDFDEDFDGEDDEAELEFVEDSVNGWLEGKNV
jgi:hypothetical protein